MFGFMLGFAATLLVVLAKVTSIKDDLIPLVVAIIAERHEASRERRSIHEEPRFSSKANNRL